MNLMKASFSVIFCLMGSMIFLSSCATAPEPVAGLSLMPVEKFEKTVRANTQRTQVYSGLYNTIDASGTLINSEVALAKMDQEARQYQWDLSKYTTEKVKSDENMKKESEIFLSFYTPERKHDDLHKNQTLWKIFLDVDGKRFEGKAKKIKLLTEEVQSLYPYHTRFATPYSITFPVGMKSIENSEIQLMITGPVGSARLKFPSHPELP